MVKWKLESEMELPKGYYFDDDDMLRDPDGGYLPDGAYIISEGEILHYEGFYQTGRFDLIENNPSKFVV